MFSSIFDSTPFSVINLVSASCHRIFLVGQDSTTKSIAIPFGPQFDTAPTILSNNIPSPFITKKGLPAIVFLRLSFNL